MEPQISQMVKLKSMGITIWVFGKQNDEDL